SLRLAMTPAVPVYRKPMQFGSRCSSAQAAPSLARFTAIIKPVRPIGAAIGYELPKKGTTNLVVIDFRERVRQARLKAPLVEPKTIEHQSDPVA
ncbi:MAG: hypothetical protein WBL86_24350, partial [Pseudolabrys sp.]